MSRWKRAGAAVGVVGAVTGAAVAAQRLAARRMRAAPDPDRDHSFQADFDRTWRLPSHDGGELYVVDAGSGPPIVLSHGVTLSVHTWSKQIRALADAGFRVIAFDHRGHGSSTVGADRHGLEQLGADVQSVLEGLDLTDAVIVGHSMGGMATQVFCLDHPEVARERVAGIVLLSTLARSPFAANPRLAKVSTWVADRVPDASGVLRARDLGFVVSRLGFGRNPSPSHVEATRQMMLATSPETRRDATLALGQLNLTGRLGEIDRPTLVICGTADLLTPIAESRRIAARIPGARLEAISGGGHMLMFERTERLNRLIVDFAHEVQSTHRAASVAGTPG